MNSVRALLLFTTIALVMPGSMQAAVWRYDVDLVRAGKLDVEAWLPAGANVAVGDSMERFVSAMRVETKSGWTNLTVHDDRWQLRDCPAQCHVRYSFDLAGAASSANDLEVASDAGDAIISPPGAWLVRPDADESATLVRIHVVTHEGLRFVTGIAPAADGAASTYESPLFPDVVYSAFGRLDVTTIPSGNTTIELATIRNGRNVDPALLREWVARGARAVTKYYSRLPKRHILVLVRLGNRRGINGGTAIGGGGAAVTISVGEGTTRAEFDDDWRITHELTHLTFPSLRRQHHWLEEGIATYVEPVARAQAGLRPTAMIWRDLADGLPQGEPAAFDRGLDRTHTWGRTYWGGALFCLVADVEIHRQTQNRLGLQDALRAIMNAQGTIDHDWSIERTLQIGDTATGTHVLMETYKAMSNDAHPVDLEQLFGRLGVPSKGSAAVISEDAPDAAIRKAIERGPAQ